MHPLRHDDGVSLLNSHPAKRLSLDPYHPPPVVPLRAAAPPPPIVPGEAPEGVAETPSGSQDISWGTKTPVGKVW